MWNYRHISHQNHNILNKVRWLLNLWTIPTTLTAFQKHWHPITQKRKFMTTLKITILFRIISKIKIVHANFIRISIFNFMYERPNKYRLPFLWWSLMEWEKSCNNLEFLITDCAGFLIFFFAFFPSCRFATINLFLKVLVDFWIPGGILLIFWEFKLNHKNVVGLSRYLSFCV